MTAIGYRKDKDTTASSLFGVAAIQGLVGGLGWYLYRSRSDFGLLEWIISFSGGIYLLLGIAPYWIRLPSAIIAAATYAAFLVYQATVAFGLIFEGLLFKVPILCLLLLALITAIRNGTTQGDEPDRGRGAGGRG